jgi:hypothetical protein
VSFVYGCNALNQASRQQQATAQAIESLPRGTGHLAPNNQH